MILLNTKYSREKESKEISKQKKVWKRMRIRKRMSGKEKKAGIIRVRTEKVIRDFHIILFYLISPSLTTSATCPRGAMSIILVASCL